MNASSPPIRASVYDRFAPLYDLVYGAGLAPGRRRAMALLSPQPGERVLEVGIGTGAGSAGYPTGVSVVGVDLSGPMLRRAARRLREKPVGATVHLARMDAAELAFPTGAFHAVYAPYMINVVPDPVKVGLELRRVCRPGGRIVLLNHFAGRHAGAHVAGRVAGRIAARLGEVDWHVDLDAFLQGTGLQAARLERVNFAGVTSLVLCHVPPLTCLPPEGP